MRNKFETELKMHLKTEFKSFSNMKVNKNEIVIKFDEANALIGFSYLSKSMGYAIHSSVIMPALSHFYNEISPPYRPNLFSGCVMAMSSEQESNKSFSNRIVSLPDNDEKIMNACLLITEKIKTEYLLRIEKLVKLEIEAIDDILDNPDYYAYPFLTILYIIKKNNVIPDKINLELILSKRITGRKTFDKELLSEYLSTYNKI